MKVWNYYCCAALMASTALVSSVSAEEQVIQGSRSFLFSENNNHVITHQREAGEPSDVGDVKIEFYGHMAFKITSPKGVTIMIDPWRNDPTGVFGVWYPSNFPEVYADIVLSSHAHFDHDAIYQVHAAMNLERLAGSYELGDVKIQGLADKHQCHAPGKINWTQYLKNEFDLDLDKLCPENSSMSWDNVIYKIETGGLKIGFWGDNRPKPAPSIEDEIRDLDILIMNIDGSGHILSYDQIEDVLQRLKPKAVIPGHYLQVGTVLASSTLESADEWVAKQADRVVLDSPSMVFSTDLLKGARRRVYYYGDQVKSD